ncbi:peptidase [Aureococcus anophagefferens]|nr:peptidase [Aureococcus anophagefferens]
MGEAAIVDAVCKLAGTETPVVAYLGTATYDFEKFREGQVKSSGAAAAVVARRRRWTARRPDVAAALERCDAVLVSGGNTLFAVDRWTAQGVDAALEKAMRPLNGVLRAEDFAGMLLRHPGEQGVCIDHFAALVVDGEDSAVLALDGKPGTLVAGGTEPDFSGAGTPAIWLKSKNPSNVERP